MDDGKDSGAAVMTYDAATLQAAAGALAGVCDYAQELDGRGFNGVDAHFGHLAAELPIDLWDDDTCLAVWDMLHKYKTQLAGFGIGWDAITRPPGADQLEEDRREARARAREAAKAWRRQQQLTNDSYVACDGYGETVLLFFARYDPDLVDQARRIFGRRYNGTANEFPFTSLRKVIALADEHCIPVPPEVRALLTAKPAPAADPRPVVDAAPQVNVYLEGGRIVVRAPYNPRLLAELRSLNKGKATWDDQDRVHRLPRRVHPYTAIDLAARHNLLLSEELRDLAAVHEVNLAESSARTADPVDIPGLAPGMTLKDHQWPAVRYARRGRRVIIGDEMGFGKTVEALATVAAEGAFPVIIVCRPKLTLNWVSEIRQFFPSWDVHVAEGISPAPILPGPHAIVIGTAALGAVDKQATAKAHEGNPNAPKVFPWVPVLADLNPKALIFDEGQDAKEHTANRSQALKQLADCIDLETGLRLDLTGTAIVNRVKELCQQLDILGHMDLFGGRAAFLRRYPNDDKPALLELHRRLRAWGIMVRRSDVSMLNLPPLRQHVLPVDPDGLPADLMARYREAEADVVKFLADQAAKIAADLGLDPGDARVKKEMAAKAAEHLVLINTLRQIIGEAKTGVISRWVRTQVMTGEKVMVAAHHHPVVDAFAGMFGGLTIRGGQSTASVERDKARFQGEPVETAPVITVSITAGGVGHTLTAAAVGIQVECPWTPGDYKQMAYRLYRIGQAREVHYFRALVNGTVDMDMDAVVVTKQGTLDAVLDGKVSEGDDDDERAAAAAVAWRLAQQGLSARKPVEAA